MLTTPRLKLLSKLNCNNSKCGFIKNCQILKISLDAKAKYDLKFYVVSICFSEVIERI